MPRKPRRLSAGIIDPAAKSLNSWHPYIFITEASLRGWKNDPQCIQCSQIFHIFLIISRTSIFSQKVARLTIRCHFDKHLELHGTEVSFFAIWNAPYEIAIDHIPNTASGLRPKLAESLGPPAAPAVFSIPLAQRWESEAIWEIDRSLVWMTFYIFSLRLWSERKVFLIAGIVGESCSSAQLQLPVTDCIAGWHIQADAWGVPSQGFGVGRVCKMNMDELSEIPR